MSHEKPPAWIVPVMRLGYIGRGVVYLLVGVLAMLAALRGGDAEGTTGALETLRGESFGLMMLAAIAAGLAAYAVWRFLAAIYDLEQAGDGLKGWAVRAGLAGSGLAHAALAAYAAALAIGVSAVTGGGGGQGGLTARLMAAPFGRWLIAAVGIVLLFTAANYARQGLKETWKQHIRRAWWTERLAPAMTFGLLARAVVRGLVGAFVVYAAWSYDPEQAGGAAGAFEAIRAMSFGRVLLAVTGLGMVAFTLYCWVEAAARVIPGAPTGPTLAEHAEQALSAARTA